MPWSIDQALEYLDDHVNLEATVSGHQAGPPSLEPMRRLASLLGDPQDAAPVIHVTGTNGKGSTTRMISALVAAHGLSVGTYTSPDLSRVNERISRNGEEIDDDDLARSIEAVAVVEDLSGIRPTRFDVLTLAAFAWFAEQAVHVAVVEVGLGGRWDSTNVADGLVAVVTNVGLDHTEYLGPTRAHVAGEKAGIVKPRSTAVVGEPDPDLVSIFESADPERLWWVGRDFGCDDNQLAVGGRVLDLRTPHARYPEVHLPLHGAHQGSNAAVALASAEAFFDRALDPVVVAEGFESVQVPGRFEVLGRRPLVVVDGAHNPEGARSAAATLDDFAVEGQRILVVGMNRERDADELLAALGVADAGLVVACAADWPRAMAAEAVAAAASRAGVEAIVVPHVADAVAHALAAAGEDDVLLVTGSLYVVGDARQFISSGQVRSRTIRSGPDAGEAVP